MMLGIQMEGWLTILAVLLSPLIALRVQAWLEDRRSRYNRKLTIFRNLMTTRASRMAPQHIEALNSIEIEFYAKTGPEKKVLDAWRELVNHLNVPSDLEGEELRRWGEKQDEYLVELLHEMAKCLGYDIDKVTIRKNAYYPKGYGEVETELHALRKAALGVFSGRRPFPMTIFGPVNVVGSDVAEGETPSRNSPAEETPEVQS